ncbi:MAG: hypothetical protein QOI62_2149 [Solirubrobacteraceae bacterium]|nr:hypothetical protein [Solirubrobacteraceae bacterium]
MGVALARRGRAPTLALAVAAACLLGAEGIHAAVIADHFAEWWAEGLFFFVLCVLEAGLAVALLLAPSRRVCQAAVAASVATVGVWAWSRTVGVPLGPNAGYPEPAGRVDVVATVLETLTALALAPTAMRSAAALRRPVLRSGPLRSTGAALVAVALVTAFGLSGVDAHAHHAAHAPPAPINVAAGVGGH